MAAGGRDGGNIPMALLARREAIVVAVEEDLDKMEREGERN
jgi:hypothetical protein